MAQHVDKNMVFSRVAGLRPNRNAFDLSYYHIFTTDMGILYPVTYDECVPGDHWKMSNEIVIRMMPLIAPIMHEIGVYAHAFFCPFRLLQKDWDKFISGGKDGKYVGQIPKWPLPVGQTGSILENTVIYDYGIGSMWDALGFPVATSENVTQASNHWVYKKTQELNGDNTKWRNVPDDFARRMYNFIWDEYYRDQNLQLPINDDGTGETQQPPDVWAINPNSLKLQYRNWKKDYKRAALPFRQRGTAPSFSISGVTQAVFEGALPYTLAPDMYYQANTRAGGIPMSIIRQPDSTTPGGVLTGSNPGASSDNVSIGINLPAINFDQNTVNWLNQNTIDNSGLASFDIADFRTAFQLQKWLERNARTGVRYTEFLKAHFGVAPTDERLNRPEYIGGTYQHITVSEVLQTSESNLNPQEPSPQGTMAGHGLSATNGFIGTYKVMEFGAIMTILSIMPEPIYEDGINRQFLRNEKEDFYFPEFAHLSEQEIFNCEVFPTGNQAVDMDIWGFIPKYDEMRYKPSKVTGLMRTKMAPSDTPTQSLSFWHLAESFSALPPLNGDMIKCNPSKRIFAVPTEPGFLVTYGSINAGVRPMPLVGEPGLVDHF